MKKLLLISIILLCLIGGVISLLKGCDKPSNVQNDHYGDSLVEKAMKDSITYKRFKDSATACLDSLVRIKDSAVKENINYKTALKTANQNVSGLLDELDRAETDKDTASYVLGCDSLRKEVVAAKILVGRYVVSNDSISAYYEQIIKGKDTIIRRVGDLFTETNNSLFQGGLRYSALEQKYNKAIKPRRFMVGPCISYGVTPNGLKPLVGVSFAYALIKL